MIAQSFNIVRFVILRFVLRAAQGALGGQHA